MIGNTNCSFLARMRRKIFNWRLDREIFGRMFPHLQHERDHGYPFTNAGQMNAQTEVLDVRALLDEVEEQADRMPKAYGEIFRHILHRDLCERLSMYSQEAGRQAKPDYTEHGFVATQV